jgi:hypothetical protein
VRWWCEVTATEYAGRVAITWPKTKPGQPLPSWGIRLTDTDTGRQLLTVTGLDITIKAEAGGVVEAVLTMFTDEHGRPLLDGFPMPPPDEDGNYPTSTFRWLVAEMRTAQ